MPQIDFSAQLIYFSISLVLGVGLSFIYSIFKSIRIISSRKILFAVLLDVLFMVIFTVATLVLSIGFTDGFVRYYVVAGEIMGFLLYKFTLGKLTDSFFVFLLRILRKTVYYIQKFFVGFIKKLLKARDNMLYNKENKNHTCMKKKERRTDNEA